jgi:glycine/D-amino acid oxidase-like deaminating enzyme
VPCTELIVAAGPWSSKVLETLSFPSLPVESASGHSVTLRIPPGRDISATAVFASIHGVNRRPRTPSSSSTSIDQVPQKTTETPEFFPRTNGTIFVGGEDEELPMPDDPAAVGGLMDEAIVERLMRAVRHVSSMLAAGAVLKREVCSLRRVWELTVLMDASS